MHVPNYVHQRLLIANFSGHDQPRDFVVKLGSDVLAFNDQFEVLWHYRSKWHRYPEHAAYIPASATWTAMGATRSTAGTSASTTTAACCGKTFLGDHADSVLVDRGGTEPAAIVSGGGQVLDGQRPPPAALRGGRGAARAGGALAATCGPSYRAANWPSRYNGHHADVMIVAQDRCCAQSLPGR